MIDRTGDYYRYICVICQGRYMSHSHKAQCPACHPKPENEQDRTHMTSSAFTKLPTEAKARKAVPLATGCLDYFPDALAAVAELSRIGNDQHNPGQPLHWSREKSNDHPDCLARHFVERGTIDTDKVRHSTKVCWRALAILQLEIEAAKASSETTS